MHWPHGRWINTDRTTGKDWLDMVEIDAIQHKLLDMIIDENRVSKTYLVDYIRILARYTTEKEKIAKNTKTNKDEFRW